jgi:hypothetical protein
VHIETPARIPHTWEGNEAALAEQYGKNNETKKTKVGA